MSQKEDLREKIWRIMEKSGVARFPRPVYRRIPNFEGSEKAARRLFSQHEFQKARVVKVNPDAPQAEVRRGVLMTGKSLVIPTPRLRRGFLVLNPGEIPRRDFHKAGTIRGSLRYGRPCALENLPKVELVVVGSVAVSVDGFRLGKGGGYGDVEYGMLRMLGLVDEETPIYTTLHELQIIEQVPREEHDLVVDVIITPNREIRTERRNPPPRGIIWEKLAEDAFTKMPVLSELKELLAKRVS